MTKVIPAILEKDPISCRRRLQTVRQLTDRVQLDIIDGELIDNRTVQPQQIEPQNGLKIDVHLMVKRPLEYLPATLKLRPYTILVQYEGADRVNDALDKIKANGIRSGISINPDTVLDEVKELIDKVDYVLLMAYPAGFAGQKLQPLVLKRVGELRASGFAGEVGLDGGVEAATLAAISKVGFDVVNTNSYLFSTDRILTRYHDIMEALN
jgi:ribulose-phosphate 3-epimerase